MNQLELETLIKKYQTEYYDGNQTISDSEFDKLWDELSIKYPDSQLLKSIGEDTIEGKKVTHLMVMGSQSKFNTYEGLCDWVRKESIQFPVIIESKVDGNSCELQYQNGQLIVASTRGNGAIGEDCTRVLKHIVPNNISYLGKNLAIRGEVVMNRDLFSTKYSNEFKNPRNLTAGLLKNENFTNFSDLRFIAYDTNNQFNTEKEKYKWLKFLGFDVVDCYEANSIKEVEDYHNKRNSKDMPYDIDGLVIKQNTIDPNDANEYRPKKIHAYKWGTSFEETILTDIEWHMQGNTLTPVAIFNEIFIDGSLVHRATLHNLNFIQQLDLEIGDRIGITKFGEIIPGIAINLSKNIKNNNYVDY